MSSGFKRSITTTKNRLNGYITNLTIYAPNINQVLSNEDNKTNLEVMLQQIRHDLAKISHAIESIEKSNASWVQFITKIEDDAKQDQENVKYENYVDDADSFIDVVDNAKEIMDVLKAKEDEAMQFLETLTSPDIKPLPQPSISRPPQAITFNLPNLNIEIYDGNPKTFERWKQIYEATIHNNDNISVIHKFHLLIGYLAPKAKRCIMGLAITEANYQTAWDTLLRKSANKPTELRSTLDTVQAIVKQLETQGEDVDHSTIHIHIEDKFPSNIFAEIYSWKKSHPNFLTKELIDKLDEIISLKEEITESWGEANEEKPKHERSIPADSNKPSPAAQCFAIKKGNNSYKSASYKKKRPCLFCDQASHGTTKCNNYSSPSVRKDKLRQMGRCFRCLVLRDSSHKCENTCHFCQGPHHKLICWNAYNNQPQQDNKTDDPNSSDKPNHNTRHPNKQNYQNKNKFNSHKSHGSSSNNCHNAHVVTATNEHGNVVSSIKVTSISNHNVDDDNYNDRLLMTTKSEVFNPEKPQLTFEAYIFIDPGSEISFISDELLQTLAIEAKKPEILKIYPFGSNIAQEIISSRVKIGFQMCNGDTIIIEAWSKQGPLTQKLQKQDPDSDLASNIQPQVLIGIDHFFDLVKLKGSTLLSSGFYKLDTHIGTVISGKGKISWCEESPPSINSINMEYTQPTNNEVNQFWNLETIGILEEEIQSEDELAQKYFQDTIQFIDGRYQLPDYPAFPVERVEPSPIFLHIGLDHTGYLNIKSICLAFENATSFAILMIAQLEKPFLK
uniref:Peptidase aspartic putative domain-containing protein n=1 Tax=Acrobeloides nanus TaxID=290746 RepID=A0A914EMR7_9BILA